MSLVKVRRDLLHPHPWAIAGAAMLLLLGILKATQRGLQDGFAVESFVKNILVGRITNISFWMLFLAWLWVIVMTSVVTCFHRHLNIDEEIDFDRTDILRFALLTVFQWLAYLQAMYRDGGTFFFAIGKDRFPAEKAGRLLEVHTIQIVEGIVILIALCGAMAWCCVGFRLLRHLPNPMTTDDRESAAAECAATIVRWSCIPVLVVLLPSIAGAVTDWPVKVNWTTGIKDTFLAQTTAIFMWGAFLWLAYRAWIQCAAVLEGSLFPLIVKSAPELKDGPKGRRDKKR